MNLNRPYFGRLKINSQSPINLGRADLSAMTQRFVNEVLKARTSTPKIDIVIELSTDPLPSSPILDRETVLTRELQNLMAPDDEEVYDGVTAGDVARCMESQEYLNYATIAQYPDKRIGLTPEQVQSIRSEYFAAWPRCAPHFPLWVDS